MDTEARAAAYAAALRLLARREHSTFELRRKLRQRGHAGDVIDETLQRVADEGYLSDARYADLYTVQRVARGYGELRIEAELLERGVDRELISTALAPFAQEWPQRLAESHRRRFGEDPPADARDWQRRARFLTGRGYRPESIRRFLGSENRLA